MFSRTILQASALLFTAVTAQTACNNSPSLCSRPYNNITQLGSHDAAFLRDESTSFNTAGNQFYNATVQLSAGVRMLTAQVHQLKTSSGSTEWHLCHGDCIFLDAGTLEKWLGEIKTWMDSNTNDVVTLLLVNSDKASAEVLGGQFSSSGIDKYAYAPPSNGTSTTSGTAATIPQIWPTLDNLISNNTRLITFVASLPNASPKYPYLLDEFTYVYENGYENTSPSSFSCSPDRPTGLNPGTAKSSNRMFLMNHFLYENQGIQTPNVTATPVTNAATGDGSLGSAIQNCTGVYDKPPNFVLVDFFNVGPAIESVDRANGIEKGAAVGRKEVSTAIVDEKSKSGGSSSGAATVMGKSGGASLAALSAAIGVAVLGLGL